MKRRSRLGSAKEGSAGRLERFLVAHERFVLAGIVLVALFLRILNLFEIEANDPYYKLLSVDPKVFHDWAVRISRGDVLGSGVFFLSPLYPYFLGLVYAIFGEGFFVGRLMQCLMGGLDVILLYAVAKRAFGMKAAFAAALLAALYVMSVFYSGVFLVTNLQTTLNLCAVLLLQDAFEKRSAPKMALAGVAVGLSALARPNALLLAPLVLAWLWLSMRREVKPKRMLLLGTLFAAGLALVVAPVAIRNRAVGGDLVLVSSQGGANFYIGNGPGANGQFLVPSIFPPDAGDHPLKQEETYARYASEQTGRKLRPSEVSAFWFGKGMEAIAADPGHFLALLARKLMLSVNAAEISNSQDFESAKPSSFVLRLPLPTFGLVAPFGLLGMALAARQWRKAFFLYAVIAVFGASMIVFFVLAHYRMPAVPFLEAFAGYAVVWLVDKARAKSYAHLLGAFLGLAVLFAAVHKDMGVSEPTGMIHYNLGNRYKDTGKWDLAVAEYVRSIADQPDYAPAHNNLALAYEQDPHTYDKAIEQWEIALELGRKANEPVFVERAQRHLKFLREAVSRKKGGSSSPRRSRATRCRRGPRGRRSATGSRGARSPTAWRPCSRSGDTRRDSRSCRRS